MRLNPTQIQLMLPHGQKMCMIDEVTHHDSDHLVARSARHLDPSNPLRRSCGLLPISAGLEFAGQATALHGALLDGNGSNTPREGFLVMAKDVTWRIERLDTLRNQLEIVITLIARTQYNAMYQFLLNTEGEAAFMSGRIAVMYASDIP